MRKVISLVGNTPILKLNSFGGIYAKAEFLNPGGSIKDRIAKFMIEEAIVRGELKPGMTIIEPSSGNTGIGLALFGRQLGFEVMIAMPENMSLERKKLMKAFGATLIETSVEDSIAGSVDMVNEIVATDPEKYYLPNQFENLDNPKIHYLTTGPEIFNQLETSQVDIFLNGIGSGGTLMGVGKFLKNVNPNLEVYAVEPKDKSAILGHEPGLHRLEGIGDGFVPEIVDIDLIDGVVEVTDDDAVETARAIAKNEGCIVGTSSGAHVWAGNVLAERFPDKVIVTTLPDRGERYFSSSLI